MASPLASLFNARILWVAGGGRTSGRDGMKRSAGQAYLIKAYLKRVNTQAQMDDQLGLPAVKGSTFMFKGYCVAFAPVSASEAENFATLDLSTLTFDETALLPAGLNKGVRARLYINGLGTIDTRFLDREGKFGFDGIGDLIRGALGDSILLEGGAVG